jgi:glycosyltransferase 2 family protein
MTSTKKQKKNYSRKAISLFGFLISLACLGWLIFSIKIDKFIEQLINVKIEFVLIAILLTFLSYILRSWRWTELFEDKILSFKNSYKCLILGFFWNNILPARIGEFVRAHLCGKETKESRAKVLATIAAERLADGVTISLIFVFCFALTSKSGSVEESKELYYAVYLFGFASLFTAILLTFRNKIFQIFEMIAEKYAHAVLHYGISKTKKFIEGLEPILKPKVLIVISLQSVLVWSVEMMVYFFVSKAFGLSLDLGSVSLFLAAVNFSSLVPSAPAGIGVIEAFATLALVHIGIEKETALAMVGTQHLIQILSVGLPGIYFSLRNSQKVIREEVEKY